MVAGAGVTSRKTIAVVKINFPKLVLVHLTFPSREGEFYPLARNLNRAGVKISGAEKPHAQTRPFCPKQSGVECAPEH